MFLFLSTVALIGTTQLQYSVQESDDLMIDIAVLNNVQQGEGQLCIIRVTTVDDTAVGEPIKMSL